MEIKNLKEYNSKRKNNEHPVLDQLLEEVSFFVLQECIPLYIITDAVHYDFFEGEIENYVKSNHQGRHIRTTEYNVIGYNMTIIIRPEHFGISVLAKIKDN